MLFYSDQDFIFQLNYVPFSKVAYKATTRFLPKNFAPNNKK